MRCQAPEEVGGGAVKAAMKSGKLLQKRTAQIEKEIGELDEVWKEADKPAKPRLPVKRAAELKEEIDDDN